MTYDIEENRRANGEFGNKPYTDAEDGVVTPVSDPSISYTDLYARVTGAETKLVEVAGQALSAIVKESYPNATSITVIDGGAEDGEARHLVLASIKEGDTTIYDATVGDGDDDFLEAVNYWTPTLGRDINALNRVKKNRIWGIGLTGEAGPAALQAAAAQVAELTDLADNGNKRLGEVARANLAATVKEKFPDAASVVLVNENSDGDGWPYLSLQSVQDAAGNTLFDAEEEDDEYEFIDDVNDWAVATDRDLDALEDLDEGMQYEGTWRLKF